MSVEICSGEGNGRASSENWTMRPGVGSTATVTRSMAAGGGFDSRSSKASVRAYARRELQPAIATIARAPRVVPSVLIMQMHVEHSGAAVTLLKVRLELIHQTPEHEGQRLGSSMGHSRSSDCSNRSSGTAGTSGHVSSPRARRCQSVS